MSASHLAETIEEVIGEIDWLLAADWSKDELSRKMRDIRASLTWARIEAKDLALVYSEEEEP